MISDPLSTKIRTEELAEVLKYAKALVGIVVISGDFNYSIKIQEIKKPITVKQAVYQKYSRVVDLPLWEVIIDSNTMASPKKNTLNDGFLVRKDGFQLEKVWEEYFFV